MTEEHQGEPEPMAEQGSRNIARRLIEVAVTLVVLGLALRGVEWQALWAALRGANYLWLIPGILVTVGLLFLKAWRWKLLFLPEHHLPFPSVMTATCAGYLGSNVLPGRAGELLRLVLLVSEQPVSVARTFSTIIVERILDLLTVIIVLVITLPFVQLPQQMLAAAEIIAIVSLAGAGVMVLLSFWRERVLGWAHALFGRIRFLDRPQIYDAIAHLIDGFAALRGRMGLLQIGVSLVGWVGVIIMAWSAGQAVPLDVPFTAYVFAVVVTTLSMLLPSTPGYVGVFHGAAVLAMSAFGVPKDEALTFALLWHTTNYLTLSISGLVALAVHGVSFGQLRQRLRRGRIEPSAENEVAATGAVTKEVG